jgi:hypothetical protein
MSKKERFKMINKLNAISRITGGVALIGITASTVIGFGVNQAYAVTIGTQDLIVFDRINIDTGNGLVDVSPTLISTALSSINTSVNFPGGGTFSSSTAFPGLATNEDLRILNNTEVITGVFDNSGQKYFSLLISSNIESVPRNFGLSDLVQFDLGSALPGVSVGQTGTIDASTFLFTIPSNQSSENDMSPLEVAVSRASSNQFLSVSQDGSNVSQVFNQPFTIAEGSNALRYFGKGLMIVGGTATGTLGGAAIGAAPTLGLGALPGAIIGGTAALFTTVGGAIVVNTDKAPETPKTPPKDLTPPSAKAVPEPLTILGTATALGFGAFFKRKLKSSESISKEIAKVG